MKEYVSAPSLELLGGTSGHDCTVLQTDGLDKFAREVGA